MRRPRRQVSCLLGRHRWHEVWDWRFRYCERCGILRDSSDEGGSF